MGHPLKNTLHHTKRRRTLNRFLSPDQSHQLESRLLLAANPFNGLYAGTFQGTASAFGSTIEIPSEDFPNNQILSKVHDGTINNILPGNGAGNVQPNGSVSFGTITSVFGLNLPIQYSGSFVPGPNGTVNGSGTWSIGANEFGVAGSGTWNTHRLNDTPGVDAASTFRLDSNNNRLWNPPTTGDSVFKLGNPADIPVAGNWQAGTHFDNVGVFRDGFWFLDTGNRKFEGPLMGDFQYRFGTAGDKPVVGDWDGDGDDDIGIFRNGRFYLDANGNHLWDGVPGGDKYLPFGNPTDLPVVGDWNGDGIDDIGVFRNVGSLGRFYLDANGSGTWSTADDALFTFGNAGDKPVVGDWDGDGDDDVGVVRNGTWYLDQNGNRAWNGTEGGDARFNFGSPTDIPLAGRWRPNDIPLLPPPPPPMMSLPLAPASNAQADPSASIAANQLALPSKPKKSNNATEDLFAQLAAGSFAL